MSATPLPSRERVAELSCTARSPEEAADIEAILEAFRVGDLKTEAEWREAIDYEAAVEHLKYLRGLELTVGAMAEVLAAALGDSRQQ